MRKKKQFKVKAIGFLLALTLFSTPLLAGTILITDGDLSNKIKKALVSSGDVNVTGSYKDATGASSVSAHGTIQIARDAAIGQGCSKGSLANKSDGSLLACVGGHWANASSSSLGEYAASTLWWLTSDEKNNLHVYSGYWKYAWTSAFVAKYTGYYTIEYMSGDHLGAGTSTVVWTKTWLLHAGDNIKTYHSGAGGDENRTYINGAYVYWNSYGNNGYYVGEGFRVANFKTNAPAPL